MIKDSLIKIPHEPLVSNQKFVEIQNVKNKHDHRRKYISRKDAEKELNTVANAFSNVRNLSKEEFDSIPLQELIFTSTLDEKMFIAQVILQNSKFVTLTNRKGFRRPTIIMRTKNVVNQKGVGGIDFGLDAWDNIRHDEFQASANIKYWYKGYALFLSVDARDGFNWEHEDKSADHVDWLSTLKTMFEDFGHGHRFKHNDHVEHTLNYKSFRSHLGVHIVDSIPSIYEIEDDEGIAQEAERLYNKYMHRIAKRINIDELSAKLSTDDDLIDIIGKLPLKFRDEFSTMRGYMMTSSDYANRSYDYRRHTNADYQGYKNDPEKRERANRLFKIHALPDLKQFVARHGGDSYESSITRLVEEHIHLFASDKVVDIVNDIVNKIEPTASIYNTIVALK